MRYIALFFLIVGFSYAKIPYEQLVDKPRGIAKDYYIWTLLKNKEVSSKEAIDLLGQASRVNRKLFLQFAENIDDEGFKFVAECMRMKAQKLKNRSSDCIEIGLSPYSATKLSKNELLSISKKVEKEYPDTAKVYQVIASKNPFEALISGEEDTFFDTFNRVGGSFRQKNFNRKIPQKVINKLSLHKSFNQSVKLIVTDPKLDNLQQSLFDVNTTELSHKTSFFLAVNSAKYDKSDKALKYLKDADKKAYFRMDKDKVLFWRYLITKDEKYLQELSQSFDINIYTQLANEKLGIIKNNVASSLNLTKREDHIDISSVFQWHSLLNKQKNLSKEQTKELASRLYSKDQEPYAAFMMERLGDYEKHYFITPYLSSTSMKKADKDRVALILALSRQESRFVPLSISTSYALGMMQFMPFVADGIAKGRYKKFDLERMFDPKWAYRFANIHLDYLQKHLDNPLFVAYAYNGGIGYTKRMLKSGMFQKNKFEPYLSMELLSYDETRRYGKKVLSNYIVYKSLIDEAVSPSNIIKKIMDRS